MVILVWVDSLERYMWDWCYAHRIALLQQSVCIVQWSSMRRVCHKHVQPNDLLP